MRQLTIVERLNLVEPNAIVPRLLLLTPTLKRAAFFRAGLVSQAFLSRRAMIVALVKARRRIRHGRVQAKLMRKSMMDWRLFGRLLQRIQGLRKNIRRIQQWWRHCTVRLLEVCRQVSQQWIQIERALVHREINGTRTTSGSEAKAKPTAVNAGEAPKLAIGLSSPDASNTSTLEDQMVEQRLMSEADRMRFLQHELRARRYELLPRLQLWEQEIARWRSDMVAWRAKNAALGLVKAERPLFGWPSLKPSQLPAEEDLVKIVKKARKFGDAGWTKIRSPKERLSPIRSANPQFLFTPEMD